MSSRFEKFANDMQDDLTIVADFVANPKEVMYKYGLSDDEISAVMNRDSSAITILTGNDAMTQGVLSGAHTPTCRPTKTII